MGRRLTRVALVAALGTCARDGAPDLVLVHGKIFSADSARPWVEALAIRGERILVVGRSDSVRALAGPGTRVLDLGGRTVIPGINDAHAHPGPDLEGVDIPTGSRDPDLREVAESLAAAARRTPRGRWLRVAVFARVFENPRANRFFLDSIEPDHPVMLESATGHELTLNSAALAALGLGCGTADPLGGRYGRVPDGGALDGRLEEYAVWAVTRRLSSSKGDTASVASFRRFAEQAARFGITSVQGMNNRLTTERASRLLREATTPLRWRVIVFPLTTPGGAGAARGCAGCAAPSAARDRVRRQVRPRRHADRAGRRDASPVRRPRGLARRINFPIDTVRAIAAEALASGEQLMFHVAGDSTAAVALSLLAAAAPDSTWRRLRPRFEHGDYLMPDQIPLARRLGVTVVQNPSHFTLPALFTARYGAALARRSQPLRSLLAAGVPLALGSDGPLNPFLNILLAVTHPANPAEALTCEQAVTAYTLGSAYAEFAEGEKGSLAPGKLADLAVLSQDIFVVPLGELPRTESVLTLVGGRVVYDAGVMR